VNFDSKVTEENCRSIDTMVSLASTAALDNKIRLEDINKQPAHVANVLKRFLRGDWDLDPANSPDDFLIDKVLLEFPVFSLNEDYLKALANIIFMKVDSVKNLLH
jgi:hypothetical protein